MSHTISSSPRFETGAHGDEDNFDGPGGEMETKRCIGTWVLLLGSGTIGLLILLGSGGTTATIG